MADTILIVDDEAAVRQVLAAYLERAGYRPVLARDGAEAASLFDTGPPDAVILDLMLPGLDGWELLRRWHAESAVPVLVLTARTEETDAIVGLRMGADDYVRKPFSPSEVVARMDALLRRARRPPEAATGPLVRGELRLESESRQAILAGQPVELTASEFDLLMALAAHPGRVFSREILLSFLRGESFTGYERTVDTHIKNLRRKLRDDPQRPRWIDTVHGVGYRFVGPPA